MKKSLMLAASFAVVCGSAFGQSAPTTVQFKAIADMQSLTNKDRNDAFNVSVGDQQVQTNLTLVCQPGTTKYFVMSKKRGCATVGNGSLITPNKDRLPRTQYMGGYVVEKDGYTDASTIKVNYLAVGRTEASSTGFAGSMNLKPELTSSGAQSLVDNILRKANAAAGTGSALIDKRVDTIDLNRMAIPSAGLNSDKGCVWSGNMVFAYQTNSWYLDILGSCGGKEYKLKGNMPWTNTPNVPDQTQYDLTLTLPQPGATSADDALFAKAGDDDLFAKADGISGQIIMKQSRNVKVKVDGVDTDTPSYVDASGSFTGTRVPLEVVRSFATLFSLLSYSFFGA